MLLDSYYGGHKSFQHLCICPQLLWLLLPVYTVFLHAWGQVARTGCNVQSLCHMFGVTPDVLYEAQDVVSL